MELKPTTQKKIPRYLAALTVAACAAFLTGCNEPALGGVAPTPLNETAELTPQVIADETPAENPKEVTPWN